MERLSGNRNIESFIWQTYPLMSQTLQKKLSGMIQSTWLINKPARLCRPAVRKDE